MLTAGAEARPKWHELTPAYSFEQYVKDFGKKYHTHEHPQRKALFDAELQRVMAHNTQKPAPMWRAGVNQFSDWTDVEKKTLRGATVSGKATGAKKRHVKKLGADMGAYPYEVDYRNHVPRILTAVKDQGQCGSCWAHATTETIESYYALATKQLFDLSTEQVAACSPASFGGGNCNGNEPAYALQYATGVPVQEEWTLPYQMYWGSMGGVVPSCPAAVPTTGVQLAGFAEVEFNDAGSFIDALATVGPLAIVVDASAWSPYESGVFNGCPYNADFGLDHAVQAIGYGHDDTLGVDYWIVRNSWNAAWGESGFIRLLREPIGQTVCSNVTGTNTCGTCGLLSQPLYAVMPTWVTGGNQ
jgi:cathepsin L